MNAHGFTKHARKHWTTFLPTKVKELREDGQLEAALQAVGRRAQARVVELMTQGYRPHEAEEVARSELVMLPPEPGAGMEDWEIEELAKLERE
jgi:hypothetical protein